MKYILSVIFIFTIFLFAKDIEVKNQVDLTKPHLKSIHNKELSKEELAFQKYKAELEKENEKLEDDGFCSCNNN